MSNGLETPLAEIFGFPACNVNEYSSKSDIGRTGCALSATEYRPALRTKPRDPSRRSLYDNGDKSCHHLSGQVSRKIG